MKIKFGTTGLLSDDRRTVAQFNENGMIYRGINNTNKKVLRYRIDGAMISGGVKKCDHALGLPEEQILYLIELKGSDLKKAAEQIYETISALRDKLDGMIVHGRAVCSRIPKPDLRSSQIIRLERALAQRQGSFFKQSKIIEEII